MGTGARSARKDQPRTVQQRLAKAKKSKTISSGEKKTDKKFPRLRRNNG